MRLACVPGVGALAAHCVDDVGHRLQVRRLDAGPSPTGVVEHLPGRHRANLKLIRDDVGPARLAVVFDAAVALLRATLPEQTTGNGVADCFGEESSEHFSATSLGRPTP